MNDSFKDLLWRAYRPSSRASTAIFAALILFGCETIPEAPAVDPSLERERFQRQQRIKTMAIMERQLLAQAEDALKRDRLTTPAHDNAFDRFKSVLLINPESQKAKMGIEDILLSYADRIQGALNAGRFSTADSLLSRAVEVFPDNPLLAELKNKAKARQREVASAIAADSGAVRDEWELDEKLLRNKSSELIPVLVSIAKRLKDTDESVLIYAPTDAQGRWVYRQMKMAVTGYRVRGDIRLSKVPKIKILPPL